MTGFRSFLQNMFRKNRQKDSGRTVLPQESGEPSSSPTVEPPEASHTRKIVLMILIAAAVIAASASGLIGSYRPGPVQPIPFSHHLHATNKQISCLFCHATAPTSPHASIPSVDKCLLCHNVIATNFKPIRKIKDAYDTQKPIPWVRVATIPDHVHFSHQNHIARGVDCSRCHGDVKSMDRMTLVYKLDMNFCVQCHWQNKASTSCFTCHY
ncbi:MAG: cytochrome c3 family protein [Armatimonadetes bacterium]|nr:cytochrome c3 family protein [Armatimonadota bacterium]